MLEDRIAKELEWERKGREIEEQRKERERFNEILEKNKEIEKQKINRNNIENEINKIRKDRLDDSNSIENKLTMLEKMLELETLKMNNDLKNQTENSRSYLDYNPYRRKLPIPTNSPFQSPPQGPLPPPFLYNPHLNDYKIPEASSTLLDLEYRLRDNKHNRFGMQPHMQNMPPHPNMYLGMPSHLMMDTPYSHLNNFNLPEPLHNYDLMITIQVKIQIILYLVN